jgi:hypothetical protein
VWADVPPTRIEYVTDEVDAGMSMNDKITGTADVVAVVTHAPVAPMHVDPLNSNATNCLLAVPELYKNDPLINTLLVIADGVIEFDQI